MKLSVMIGYKIFKENNDGSVELLRILKVPQLTTSTIPAKITVRDESNGEIKKISTDNLKEYSPLEPDGLMTFSVCTIRDSEGKPHNDIVVTASKILNLKIGNTLPFAVCRQNITDIFYNLLIKDESEMISGLSVNQNSCPAGFDFGLMLACDGINFTNSVNYYRTDMINDLYCMIDKKRFDNELEKIYKKHVEASNNPALIFKKQDKGWCKDLDTLLKENNFQADSDEMLGIGAVDFEISKYLEEKDLPGKDGETYTSPTDELRKWLSSIYKINFGTTTVLEFNHDINLAEFNNAKYFLLRDNTKKLYLFVYLVDGEYHELDLESEDNKTDFSTEFRLNFYNKYNSNK